jgi:D-alanine-D-alanine ligase
MQPLPILNQPSTFNNLKLCVLQPDYSTSGVDYQHYDPKRNLSSILPNAVIDHVFLNKLTTYQQLKELKNNGYDLFI